MPTVARYGGVGRRSKSYLAAARAAQRALVAARRAGAIGPSMVYPGRTRTGGFYGRFGAGPQQELKFFDTALSFTVDLTGEVPATGQLNLIAGGSTESTRVGKDIVVKSIQLKVQMLYNPSVGATAAEMVYLYLVQDTQANGAAALASDVLTATTFANAMVNMANSQRFKIIRKWVVPFNGGAGVSGAYTPVAKAFDFYKRCNIPITFNGVTGAITEVRSNNLFLLAGQGIGDDLVTVDGRCRLRYLD